MILGALGLALVAACVLLTCLTRDLRATKEGLAPALAVACGLVGLLVARRQPRNPEGWLLLGLGIVVITVFDSGLYAVLDYRMHHGQLPLGETAVFIQGTLGYCSFSFRLSSCSSPMGG
jgi:heme A synthase